MNMDNNDPQLPEIAKALHIGKMIETELRRQERSVTWFSRQLHCDRRNVYNIFSRTSIDTLLLIRISHILQCNFFLHISNSLDIINYQYIALPITNPSHL